MRKRFGYANVTSTVALFVALGVRRTQRRTSRVSSRWRASDGG
jgi:hypothetical protein